MSTVHHIPLSKLIPPPRNVRRTGSADGVSELAASIAAHGLLQNLTVIAAKRRGKGEGKGKGETFSNRPESSSSMRANAAAVATRADNWRAATRPAIVTASGERV